MHATAVRQASAEMQSRLRDLARQFPWYKEPPREGQSGYKAMKRMEKMGKARERMHGKDLKRRAGSDAQDGHEPDVL